MRRARGRLVTAAKGATFIVGGFGSLLIGLFACLIEAKYLDHWAWITVPVTAFLAVMLTSAVLDWSTEP